MSEAPRVFTTPSAHICYSAGELFIDGVSAETIAARAGTPVYVYSASEIRERYRRLEAAFAEVRPMLCYALKACGNLHVCKMLAGLGAGMDVVSGGELERAWLSGAPMSRVTFAGVGKTEAEIGAALDGRLSALAGRVPGAESRGMIGRFNAESEQECERIRRVAASLGVCARASLRVNPDVDARTHAYTTTGKKENKFGVDIARAASLFERWRDDAHLRLRGVHVHLGSPISSAAPYVEALRAALALIADLERAGVAIEELNLGGGFGIDYGKGAPAPLEAFAAELVPLLREPASRGVRVLLEPGRPIVGNAGVLLTRVQYIKRGRTKKFVVVDSGMHQLVRPALYQAYHFAWPARVAPPFVPPDMRERHGMDGLDVCDIVGPVCESSDFLAQDRMLPPVAPNDLMAIFSAGAYGMSMASTYNDHPRPAEVLADAGRASVIRPRQEIFDLVAPELGAPIPLV